MRLRAGIAGAVAALVLATAASAQTPASTDGDFGGGAVLPPPKDPLGAGNTVLGIRAKANKLTIEATIRASCGGGTFPATAKLAADGRFVAKGVNRRRFQPGLRLKTTYRITGTLTAAGIEDGHARATSEIQETGRKAKRCRSGTIAFKAHRPSGEIGAPGAAPKARYYGVTSERRHGVRRGIVLRVSSDGRHLSRALYAVTLKCPKSSLPDIVDTPRRDLTIDGQGRVTDNVHYTTRTRATVTHSVERFSGTLGFTGAKGTLSITDRTSDRKTGKHVETCTTGTVKWMATP